VGFRSLALLTLAMGLVVAALRAHSIREEGESLGTLLGVARTPNADNVNDEPVAGVNVTAALPSPSAATLDARELVRRHHEEIRTLLTGGGPPELLTRSVGSMVDYAELASRSLGKPCPATVRACTNHWDALTGEQQAEITGLLRKLVERNVIKHMQKTLDYEIAYATANLDRGAVSKVRTEARHRLTPEDLATQVDYVVLRSDRGHRVIDVITEGSSFTKNYYDQFHRMLTTPNQGYAFLATKLHAKVARP
jgi:ABC-type transporter MlaC component